MDKTEKISLKQSLCVDTFSRISFREKPSDFYPVAVGETQVINYKTGKKLDVEIKYCGKEFLKTIMYPLLREYDTFDAIPPSKLKPYYKYDTYKMYPKGDNKKELGIIQIEKMNDRYPSGDKGYIHLGVVDSLAGRKEYYGIGTKLLQVALEKSYMEECPGRILVECMRLPYDKVVDQEPLSFYQRFNFERVPGSNPDENLFYLPLSTSKKPPLVNLKQEIIKEPILYDVKKFI